MNWIEATRTVLSAFKVSTKIPYFWKRYEPTKEYPQLPDIYIVYFMVDDPGAAWADGKERSHETKIQVSLYFRDKSKYLTIPSQIEAAFMAANFMRSDSDDLPYQPDTGHYGWYCDFTYYERR